MRTCDLRRLLFDGVGTMRDCRARPQRGCDCDNLRNLLLRGGRLTSLIRVDLDAIRALRREGNGERHQVFVFHRNRSGSQGRFVDPRLRLSFWLLEPV